MPSIDLKELRQSWALVTGASSGIGLEFCRQLAAAGLNIILVARRADRLKQVSSGISDEFKIQTLTISQDLTGHHAVEAVRKAVEGHGIKIRLLCNCAGIGRWGRFESSDVESYQRLLQLNCATIVNMCLAFEGDLKSNPGSAIINVSSAAAYQPVPYMAVYAASKAFVQSFTQGLHGEWSDSGVLVQCLVPGPTETEFDKIAGAYESALKDRASPVSVVSVSLSHLRKGSPVAVSAKGIFKQRLFAGLAPPRLVIKEVAKMFYPP